MHHRYYTTFYDKTAFIHTEKQTHTQMSFNDHFPSESGLLVAPLLSPYVHISLVINLSSVELHRASDLFSSATPSSILHCVS